MRTFLIINALLVLLFLFVLFTLSVYLTLRPHRSKIFFSYSHKDTKIAERIMLRLKEYKFRVYIDFGLVIPENQLENELSKIIKKRDIFILLASKNSTDSYWVQYEIKRAQQIDERPFSNWRDMIVLALDNQGIKMAETLTIFNEKLNRDFWDSQIGWHQKLDQEDASKKAKIETSLRKGQKLLGVFPFLRRILTSNAASYDLRGRFEPAMAEVEEHLKQESRFFRYPLTPQNAKALKMVKFYWLLMLFIQMLFVGAFLVKLIL